jgi:thiamine-monophosphate kinase
MDRAADAGNAATALPVEFDRIARYFAPLAGPGGLGLRDDAAVLVPPPGRELVLSADAMVGGVHFLADDPPDLVARKLLRVNLSDLAAKGAIPLGYLLTVSVPRTTDDAWFAAFAAGLAQDQATFGVTLLGGDSTSTPGPVSLSLTIIGHVAPGTMVRRDGARAGDALWVTGTIGDGALGLLAARGDIPDPTGHLRDRYSLPQPRLRLVDPALVHASMDVSDGFIQDAGHMCRASGVGLTIDTDALPLSDAALAAPPEAVRTMIAAGDDYELLMAVPDKAADALHARAATLGIRLTRIGTFTAGAPGDVRLTGRRAVDNSGWSHF